MSTTPKSLNVAHNYIGKSTIEALTKNILLHNCTLKEINLSNNRLTDQKMAPFLDSLSKN